MDERLLKIKRDEITPKGEHTRLGIASLVSGIIAVATWFFPIFIFGLLAAIFGYLSYFRVSKDSFGLVGFSLGIICIIVNTVILALAIAIAFT